jgi:hypothetical protein
MVFLALLALDFGLSHSLFLLIGAVNVSWSGLVQSLAFFLPLEGGLLFHPDDCVCVPAMGVLVCILMLALLLWRLIFNNAVMVFWKSGARLVPLFWVQTLALCPLPLRV